MQQDEQTLPRPTSTCWFVTASAYGKRLRCAEGTLAELKSKVEKNERILCLEVIEFITQVAMSPQSDGGVSANKFHIATPLDASLAPMPVSFDPAGSDIYFVDDMEKIDGENCMSLVRHAHKVAEAMRAKRSGIILAGNMPAGTRGNRA